MAQIATWRHESWQTKFRFQSSGRTTNVLSSHGAHRTGLCNLARSVRQDNDCSGRTWSRHLPAAVGPDSPSHFTRSIRRSSESRRRLAILRIMKRRNSAGADLQVLSRDARLKLAEAPDHYYDLIVLTYSARCHSSTSLTREAMMMYLLNRLTMASWPCSTFRTGFWG